MLLISNCIFLILGDVLTLGLSFTSCTIPLLTFIRDPFYRCHIIQELEIHEFRVLNHFLTLRSHFIAHNFWVISHQNPAKSQLPVCPNEIPRFGHLLINSSNQGLDTLASLDRREGLLGLLELDRAGN